MRAFLPIFMSAAVLTACTQQPNIGAPQATVPVSDTTGFAEFREWKTKQEEVKPQTTYVVKHVPVRNVSSGSVPAYPSGATADPVPSADIPGAAEPQETQKKGWSKAAKGAAIGAGSGAVLGAVIHKRNRVVGGVVGGAVGAGVGYGIGRHIDKKDGRY